MTAKVENYCMNKITRSISVDREERYCINCIWYEAHYRMNRGNVLTYMPTSQGQCLLSGRYIGALRRPCKQYEREETR